MMTEENHISVITSNENGKVMVITYDHFLKKINLSFRNYNYEINIDYLSDKEISERFGRIMDFYGFQDGDANIVSSDNRIISDFISLIFSKSQGSVINL